MGIVIRTFALLVAASAFGLAVNAARKGGVRLAGFAAPAQCEGEPTLPSEIEPADAIAMCGRPDVVIADARSADAFARGHVADAIHLPCSADGRATSDGLARVDHAATIVVYGDSTDDARPVAASLGRRLHKPGVRVAILRGGFPAWEKAGLACASGACQDCGHEEHRK